MMKKYFIILWHYVEGGVGKAAGDAGWTNGPVAAAAAPAFNG